MSKKSRKALLPSNLKTFRSTFSASPWRTAAGLTGFAITAYLLISALGGKRGVANKARALMDFASEGVSTASDSIGLGKRNDRGDAEMQTH